MRYLNNQEIDLLTCHLTLIQPLTRRTTMAAINFNAAEVEPQSDFAPLPAGEYLVMATASEIKATKNGQGQYLQISLQVIDGNYKNRLIFDRINIQNTNSTAQEIGQRALSALCRVVGRLQIGDSAELHNIPFIVKLAVRVDQQYGDSNEVKGYKSASGSAPVAATTSRPAAQHAPTQAQAPAAPIPPRATGTGAKPAWVK